MPCPQRMPAALVVLAGALAAGTSHAAPTAELESARRLFEQAEADEDAERWSEALDKFHAVSQVKLTAGVRYHLALCEEHLGQLARALGDYRAAEDQARLEAAKDVLRLVGKQLAALDPRVPRLTIHVVPTRPDASVRLDGQPIAHTLAGAAMPVDPGVHHVQATASDRAPSTAVVTLQEYESRVLDVNLGEPLSSPSPSPSPSPPTPTPAPTPTPPATPTPNLPSTPTPPSPRSAHGLAIVATAAGVALAGGGVAAYLVAGAELNHAINACPQTVRCDSLKTRVRAWDFVAAGAWGGALVVGVVAIMLWTKPNEASTQVGTRLLVGPGAVGVEGRF
jgi:hypothetical protein